MIVLPSRRIFICRHFLKRHDWHWFLRATSIMQFPISLQVKTKFRRTLRLKKPLIRKVKVLEKFIKVFAKRLKQRYASTSHRFTYVQIYTHRCQFTDIPTAITTGDTIVSTRSAISTDMTKLWVWINFWQWNRRKRWRLCRSRNRWWGNWFCRSCDQYRCHRSRWWRWWWWRL